MNKRTLFVVAAIALAVAGLVVRNENNKQARTMADIVQAQDLSGASTAASLDDLQTYVNTHMGASVTYTLTGSYNRAVAQANAAATAASSDSQIYAAAQAACSGKTDSITQAKCNQAYLSSHLSNAPQAAPVAEPQLASYQHSLKAPTWSPDLAGALLLGAIAALILAVINKPKGRW
jgi:hypothetical protein